MKIGRLLGTSAVCLGVLVSCGPKDETASGGGGAGAATKAWGEAALLETSANLAGGVAVAADAATNGSGDGTVTVAWVQSDGSQDSIYAVRYDGGWGTPELVEAESTGGYAGGAYSPRVAMNKYGQAAVVWGYSTGPGNYRIWSNRYDNNAWQTAEHISASSGNANSPQVSFDTVGDSVFAVWSQYQLGSSLYTYRILQRQYLYARCPDGSLGCVVDPSLIGLRPISMIDQHDIGDAGEPQVAAWGNNNAVAVWTQNNGGNQIWANVAASGAWGTSGRINTGSAYGAASPVVAADPSGNAVAAWFEFVTGRNTYFASRYDGSSWSAPVAIDDSTAGAVYYKYGDPSKIKVAMDSSGNAIFVWVQKNLAGTEYSIYARRCPAGPLSGCAAPVLLESSAEYADFPDLAVGPDGDAVAVWKQTDGGARRIYANHYSASGNSWDASATLVGGADGTWNEGPQVAIDGNGAATVVWTEYEAGSYNIYGNRYQ